MKKIILIVMSIVLVLAISLTFADNIINLLQTQSGISFVAQSPGEGFSTYLNVTFILSFVMLFPMLLYFLIDYIKPAMYPKEIKILNKILKLSYMFVGLFILGCVFGSLMIFKVILPYLMNFNNLMGYQALYGANTIITFILTSIFYTGLIFQIPILNYYLLEYKVLRIKHLPLIRMVTIAGALIIGALITPPDVLSMFIFSLPIWLLFEISTIIWRLKHDRNN